MTTVSYKIPESVLVVIHTSQLQVLLLERADSPGFWQSVTGSKDLDDEPIAETARREVLEETGIDASEFALSDWNHSIEYQIYPRWRHRYAPGVVQNVEHWFGLCLPDDFPWRSPVRIAPREHLQYAWLNYREAARKCFSPSNSEAISSLPSRATHVCPESYFRNRL